MSAGDRKARVLVVEDHEENSRLVVKILRKAGYDFEVATNAREALVKLPGSPPDLVLMDMSLPGMDGFEATRLLKGHPRLARIPVVALTAHAMAEHREKAAQAGCDAYVAKPFRSAELLEVIARLLAARRQDEEASGAAAAAGGPGSTTAEGGS